MDSPTDGDFRKYFTQTPTDVSHSGSFLCQYSVILGVVLTSKVLNLSIYQLGRGIPPHTVAIVPGFTY